MERRQYQLSQQLGEILKRQQWQVSCAESCTGGWIARCITDIPGSSAWFGTGYVTYSNIAKHHLLAVPMQLLEGEQAPGAVSRETVTAMAEGALLDANAQFAVATSGIAGPDGGSREKPIGTVWIGWAWRTRGQLISTRATMAKFAGDRETVRSQSVTAALEGLLRVIQEEAERVS